MLRILFGDGFYFYGECENLFSRGRQHTISRLIITMLMCLLVLAVSRLFE